MWKKRRGLFRILFVLALVYIGVSVYFMEHFFPGTRVNGRSVDFWTTDQVMDLILQDTEDYTLTIKIERKEDLVLTPEELGVVFGGTDAAKQAKRRQNGFLWPRMFVQEDVYELVPGAEFRDGKLETLAESWTWVEEGEHPKNAWVEMTEEGYLLHPEEIGSRVDKELLIDEIKNTVSAFQKELDLAEGSCYERAEVTLESQEMQALTKQLDDWLSARVVYTFGPETEVADASVIAQFIEVEGTEAEVSEAAVQNWVNALAEKRDTYKVERLFKSTLQGLIRVKGGNKGWQMDRETEGKALLEHIRQGEQLEKEPAYLRKGNPWSSNYDIGETYIEIDLTAQHMWLYKEGKVLVDTEVVTGNMRRGHDTPEMVASIKYKARNAVLRGEDYASPVKYWMPFYGNYGIHDASWRKKFGGDIYLTNGSHGCINTPLEKVKEIYENVEVGTPVVLYY